MTVDGAALKIGQEIAKHVVRACLDVHRERDQRGKDMVDLLTVSVPDKIRRRELARQFATIGERSAQRLQPLYGVEFKDLPDNERLAAINAVADTLSIADLGDRALFDADADPVKLVRSVRRQVPNAVRQAGLSEPAAALYERMLEESCRAIVHIVQQLPAFEPRATAELLSRTSDLARQLDQIMERMPRLSSAAAERERDAEFDRQYRRVLTESLDTLELYGVDKAPLTSVSVAYLSLDVSGDNVRSARHRWRLAYDDEWFNDRRSGETSAGVPVESALAQHDRTLIRGEAGCGKTTLLQWLAVNCARGSFSGELASWNDRVPFFLRLRHYADRPLPRPEQFVDGETGVVAGLMPDGWVHRQLTDHAVLLVDGVDELAPAQRQQVRRWLIGLVASYPALPIVVTSRTGAAGKSWLADLGFGSVVIEPMKPTHIAEFSRRWHAAVRDAGRRAPGTLPCAEAELADYESALMRHFDARRDLRTLATNPLLCAMLCALNLYKHTRLPPDRMALYDAALHLLVDARDSHREVPAAQQVPLDARSKISILQYLAWRLTMDGRSELAFDSAIEYVAAAIKRLPSVDIDAETVLKFLTDRNIVIRQPVVGRVDFVHRTFLEYLAAKEATDDHWLDVLHQRAHLDQWRETIIMAAGHATLKQRTELLNKILDRADQEPRHARPLRLLASACLDTAHMVAPEVTARIDAAVSTLLPPRSRRETRSLALAGDRVLRSLPRSLSDLQELSAAAAAACVRTAALINGPNAIQLLATYAADPRVEVQRELAEVWSYFDAEAYARTVLADAPLCNGSIVVRRPEHVPLTCHLSRLTDLQVNIHYHVDGLSFLNGARCLSKVDVVTAHAADLSLLREHSNITHVGIKGPVTTADALAALPQLEWLKLWGSDLDSIAFLSRTPLLHTLILFGLTEAIDTSPIGSLERIQILNLGNCRVDPVPTISQLPELQSLVVQCMPLRNGLAGIAIPTLTELRVIAIDNAENLDALSRIQNLETLWLRECPVEDVSVLAGLSQLSDVDLYYTHVVDLRPLTGLRRLTRLGVHACPPELDLSPLAGLPRRAEILLNRGQQVRGLDAVRGRHKIKWM
jgi:NACHT domain